jgi:hypothetical protein
MASSQRRLAAPMSAANRTIAQSNRRILWTLLLAAVLMAAPLPGRISGLVGPAYAQSDEVDCSSIRLNLNDSRYDSTCEIISTSTDTVEILETNAIDGSHFLVVIDHMTGNRYVFPGGGALQSGLKDYFDKLEIEKWGASGVHMGFRTAEFVSDFKSIPSDCVAFEKYLRRQWTGWRRRIIGFGCSRAGDRNQVYEAMRLINFPE